MFRGRLTRIIDDSLYFIAKPFNADSVLNQFYLGTSGNTRTIQMSYLKSVTIHDGRVLGMNTAMGAVAFCLK